MDRSVIQSAQSGRIRLCSWYAGCFALLAALVLFGRGAPAQADTPRTPVQARADILGPDGQTLGIVTLTEAPQGVLLNIALDGVPHGYHAIHLHRIGDCTVPHFTSASGHVNPFGRAHGLLNPQGPDHGDLPNVYAHTDGAVRAELFTHLVSLEGPYRPAILDYDGAAVVMHEAPDDHSSQPIGGAGKRIGCGVIEKVE